MSVLPAVRYQNAMNRVLAAYPVTYGLPLPEGAVVEPDGLALRLADGSLLPVQTEVLQRHGDGSVRWLLLDFAMPVAANAEGEVALVQAAASRVGEGVQVVRSEGRITVTTPRLTAAFDTTEFSLFASYVVDGREMMAAGSDLEVEDQEGKRYYASLAMDVAWRIAVAGPERTVVEATGRHRAEDGSTLVGFRLRYTFRAQEPGVQVAYKMINGEAPELGVWLASVRVVLPTTVGRTTRKRIRQTCHGAEWFTRPLEIGENVEVFNLGAVNEAAKNSYGAFAEGKVLIRNLSSLRENLGEYPHFLRPGNARTDMTGGLRQVFPYVGIVGEESAGIAWFEQMELNYPKAVSADRARLCWDIWPASSAPLQLRRGQAKEHTLHVCFWSGQPSHEAMEGVYFDHELVTAGAWGGPMAPVQLSLDPDYVRTTGELDVHRWLPYREAYMSIEQKLGSAGATASIGNRGMMDLGDFVRPDRSWCHNNENDAILNGLREYYRRGEPTMRLAALLKAYHNAHVDFIAQDPDPLRQGTMPAHCPEHTDGAAYPSHMWVDGLIAAYCTSGETDFRDAALSVGENMRRWQTERPSIFYADSRECGWPMLAYLCLHDFTGETRWLDYCQEVFEFYDTHMTDAGEILYDLPHGLGLTRQGYGEFITWRACFGYWERTGSEAVKAFLARTLTNPKVWRVTPEKIAKGGWACNDLYPSWAAYQVTGDEQYLRGNLPILDFMMKRPGGFPWGGVDMHYYLAELHRLGILADYA